MRSGESNNSVADHSAFAIDLNLSDFEVRQVGALAIEDVVV